MNRHFTREDVQMANKHMERHSIISHQRNPSYNSNEVWQHVY